MLDHKSVRLGPCTVVLYYTSIVLRGYLGAHNREDQQGESLAKLAVVRLL